MYLERDIKSILKKSNLEILAKYSKMQLKENLNFNTLINLPGQVTEDEQSKTLYFLGKRSGNPENIDWIPTIFNHKQNLKLSKLLSG